MSERERERDREWQYRQHKNISEYKSYSHYGKSHKQCSISFGIAYMYILSFFPYYFFFFLIFSSFFFFFFSLVLRIPISYQNGFLPKLFCQIIIIDELQMGFTCLSFVQIVNGILGPGGWHIDLAKWFDPNCPGHNRVNG